MEEKINKINELYGIKLDYEKIISCEDKDLHAIEVSFQSIKARTLEGSDDLKHIIIPFCKAKLVEVNEELNKLIK